jgi:integrase
LKDKKMLTAGDAKMDSELSNLKCEKAKPESKPYRLADKGGLALLVTPEGGKIWRWRYRFDGQAKQMSIGKYPDTSLAQARVKHAEARALLASGVDPMAVRKEAKQEKQAELAKAEEEAAPQMTFEDLVRKWFVWWKADKNERYVANVESRLEADVITPLGQKDPAKITPRDLVELTQATDARGARDVARRNLQFIRMIFKWGKIHNYLDQNVLNPASDIDPKMILSKAVSTKYCHLDIEEVPELLRRMRDYNGSPLTRNAMELLSLTFVRTGELIAARWDEIDWKNRRWNLPKEHMKMKLPHIVPLSKQALALLERLHDISGDSGRLFPDFNGGNGTMSNNTILKGLERMGYKGRMTGHGWRHIASTYLRGQHFDKYWVEAQLSHKEAGVAGVYNEAEWLPEREKMMQFWADFLDECRSRKKQEKPAA